MTSTKVVVGKPCQGTSLASAETQDRTYRQRAHLLVDARLSIGQCGQHIPVTSCLPAELIRPPMRIIATVTGITLVAVTSAQVVINEVCSRNATVWEAPDGSHPDWIELYNASASSVQLQQFFLSDKPSEPGLWQLPALLLGAGEFVVLYSDNTAGFPFGLSLIHISEPTRPY